jgi:hypothetical protein
MSAQEQHQEFLLQRIEALRKENERLNFELIKVKELSLKIRLSDPIFNKPLSEIETNYEIVKPCPKR